MADLDSLTVTVGGDISGLQAAFDQIPAAAQTAADSINSAFSQEDAAFGTIAEQAQAASEAIGQMGGNVGDVESQFAALGESMAGMGASAGEVVSNVEQIPPALHDVAEEAGSATEKLQEFLEQGLELAGIALTLEALKEAFTEALDSFAEFQRAGESLAAVTGDVQGAAEALERIPELADALAQSIPSLEAAQQKFALFGVDLENIPGLLTAISDAARASGTDFDSVASSFERMDNTGKVMARSLQAAGLNMNDIAEAMGMTGAAAADVTKAFANLGTGAEGAAARAEVLIDATQRFQGISEQTANDVTGTWQQMSNAVHEAAVNIGESIALLGGPGGISVFKLLIQGIETFVISLIGFAQQAIDIIVGLGKVALDVFMAIGRAAAAAAQGNWSQAWQDIENGWTAVQSDVHDTMQKMADDWTANGKIIDKVWADTSASVATHTAAVATSSQAAIDKVQAVIDKFGQSVTDVLNKIPATEDVYLQQLNDGGQKATQILGQINSQLNTAMKDMGNLTMTPAQIDQMQAWIDELNKAKTTVQAWVDDDNLTKLGDKLQALADKYPQQIAELSSANQEWVRQLTQFAAAMHAAANTEDPFKQIQAQVEELKAADDAMATFNKTWETGKDVQTAATTAMLQNLGAFTSQTVSDVQAINKSWIDSSTTVTSWGGKVAAVYAMLKALKIDDVSLDQQQLAAMNANLATMEKMGLPLQDQLAVQAQILQLDLKIGDATGATAQQTLAWTEQLVAVQTQMNVLKDQTQGLSNLYTGMVKALGTAWTDLGKGLGDAMVSGQNFGAALTTVFDNLKKQIAELVTQYLLNQLKDAFLQNTNAVSDFGKMFNSIFGGAGGSGILTSGFQSATQSLSSFTDDFNANLNDMMNTFGDAEGSVKSFAQTSSSSMQQAAQSVQTSASSMVSGLSAVAAVVTAIASIFSAIELMHTNTLLDRIEHETARMAIYLGDSGSGSIQGYTGASAAYLGYIHGDIVSMAGHVESIDANIQSLLSVVAAGGLGGGSGGGGAAAFQALQTEINNALTVFKDDIAGPYGLGPAVQGVSTAASSAGSSLATLSTVASTLGSTVATTTATVAAAANTVATSFTAIVKATPVPATVAYSPGSNTFTPILPTATVPTIASGPGGSNSFTPTPQWQGSGGGVLTVVTNIQPGIVAMNNSQQIQQFSDLVSKNVVTKLQQVSGLKMR